LAPPEEGRGEEPLLTSTEEVVPLAGEYVNLHTGKPVDLAELRGKTVFIDFWATWCGPCLVEIPELKSFAQKHSDRSDFTFISVLADATAGGMDRTEAQEFVEEKGLNYPVLFDRAERPLIKQFGVVGYPTKFLIDREGRVMRPAVKNADLSLELISTYIDQQK
jgi:cytochrome c-type biogenesis protein